MGRTAAVISTPSTALHGLGAIIAPPLTRGLLPSRRGPGPGEAEPEQRQTQLLRAERGSAVTVERSVLEADGSVSADYSSREQRIDLLTVVVLGHNLGGWRRGLGETAWRAHPSRRPSHRAARASADLGPGRGALLGREGGREGTASDGPVSRSGALSLPATSPASPHGHHQVRSLGETPLPSKDTRFIQSPVSKLLKWRVTHLAADALRLSPAASGVAPPCTEYIIQDSITHERQNSNKMNTSR